MHTIKRLIAMIISWFTASGGQRTGRKTHKPHKKHVHLSITEKTNLYRLWSAGEEPSELARAFNVSMSTAYRIIAEHERKELRRKLRMKEVA
jgi:hypothetical protein